MAGTLQHIGVLGMRWGRRSAGKSSSDHTTAQALRKKKMHEMSNAELQTLSTRINLERNYKALNPTKLQKGQKAVASALTNYGKLTIAAGTVIAMAATGKTIIRYSQAAYAVARRR